MALSNQQMTRLGELLDESLPLEPVARRMWLESLPDEDRPLVRTLREALLADDPATVSSGPLDRPPRIRDLDAANERRPPARRAKDSAPTSCCSRWAPAAWPKCGWRAVPMAPSNGRWR